MLAGMQLVETPTLFPGCCAICRSGGGPMVDTGAVSTLDERLYYCVGCVDQLAVAIGAVPKQEHEALWAKVKEANAEANRLKDVEEDLRVLQDAIRTTLVRGAVRTKGTDELRLRPKPGDKAVEL